MENKAFTIVQNYILNHLTNSTNCRRCKYFTTEKCHECFGFELFTDSGYVTELNERSNK